MPAGYVALVLHGHLPFVRHPEHRDFLEERWLFEAIAECYLPLLQAFDRLKTDGVEFELTFSLSPPLLAMLRDPLLGERFEQHLRKIDRLLARELERTEADPNLHRVTRWYQRWQQGLWDTWRTVQGDIVGALAAWEAMGHVELWTCGATHAFFPSLLHHPRMIEAQVELAVRSHTRATGRAPRGMWLPECGFAPGVDDVLTAHGIAYTALESHAITHASPRPRYGTAAPLVTPAGLACFGRDVSASHQVWSSEVGYPGAPSYREFYRDVGFDGDHESVKEFIAADGTRQNTGLKYYAVSDRDAGRKNLYDHDEALEQSKIHALDFAYARRAQVRRLSARMDTAPCILAPYDAELFGHWWFEGPSWIENVFRALQPIRDDIEPTTLGRYLTQHPTHDVGEPEVSSWGAGGYGGVWLDPGSSWMLRHVDYASSEIVEIARRFAHVGGLVGRAAAQALREVMLLLSSDWAFLIKTGGAPHYARARFEAHLARFRRLHMMLYQGSIDEVWLADLEKRDNLFGEVSWDWAK
jgi:1,4-alpha-glucan branching enzyme